MTRRTKNIEMIPDDYSFSLFFIFFALFSLISLRSEGREVGSKSLSLASRRGNFGLAASALRHFTELAID